jgi:predicted permease
VETMLQDLRYGLRMLVGSPAFTFVAVLTLALGIGASTAIFSVVNGVLLRPFPFEDPERVVTLWENNVKDGIERDDVSPPNFLDWQDQSSAFDEMAAINPHSFDYAGNGEPDVLVASRVTTGFFRILGVEALHGRTFLPEEYEPGGGQVVVLSYGVWQQKFGGDPSIVGERLVLDDQPYTVVGVMPREFQLNLFAREAEVWAPEVFGEAARRQRRATYLKVIARLEPGTTPAQARAEMATVASRLAAEHPQTNAGIGVTVVPLPEQLVGRVRQALMVLFGAVGFVLLIACANVANLLLARGGEREREFAIRAAMGADRSRLVRQFLTESALLALLGCAGGLVLASWALDLIVAVSPAGIPRMQDVGLDRPVLGFAVGISLLTALVFGAAPSFQFSRLDLVRSLKEAGQTASASPVRHRLRSLLVVAEVALAVVLLAGAGLLLRSFVSLLRVDPGFAVDSVATLQVFVWDRYARPDERIGYFQQAHERLLELPGVEAAGAVSALPLLDSSSTPSFPFAVEGRPAPPSGQEPTVTYTVATIDYFRAMRIPLVSGRTFDRFDTQERVRVALVNETLARREWPGEDPVGKRITVQARKPVTLEVAGVVGDTRQAGLESESRPELFVPHAQDPSGSMIFVVRTATEPAAMLAAIKARIWEVNKTQPFYRVATMEQLLAASLAERRFSMLLMGSFAVLALVLAAVGIYGVISFATNQRTREIGIRLALGAQPRDVLGLVVSQGMMPVMVGLATGLAGALALARAISSLLYGVSPADPITFAGISLVLGGAALLACYLPARRAARVDPVVALRYE